ncbi:hypothetical protein JCM19232_5326 [Vibrio ishigakensis]|uniref:Uncharacterized protein n=1 Tax=Vibrio ishigakensis TaxID=1481914 RepID=A0A0B8PCS4_9VIBR|nr:hypothetical protein JCM19232_5326 [Vibrio ishigakensis]
MRPARGIWLVDGDQIVLSGVGELESGMKVREWIKERGL